MSRQPQLNQQLMDAASESGVVLKSGIKVKAVDTTRTAIVLENDEAVQADLIIGADGVHVSTSSVSDDILTMSLNLSPQSGHTLSTARTSSQNLPLVTTPFAFYYRSRRCRMIPSHHR